MAVLQELLPRRALLALQLVRLEEGHDVPRFGIVTSGLFRSKQMHEMISGSMEGGVATTWQ